MQGSFEARAKVKDLVPYSKRARLPEGVSVEEVRGWGPGQR